MLTPHGKQTAQQDEGQWSPVFLFGHDYGAHHGYCEIVVDAASTRCTCGFLEAFEAALASERKA